MHDSFEKEVLKKMEELNLTPTAPVWQKIELEIRPEKKRRRAFFWLFFGLLFLGGGFFTYKLFQPAKQSTSQLKVPDKITNTKTPIAPTPLEENKVTSTEKEKEYNPATGPSSIDKKTGAFKPGNIAFLEPKKAVPSGKKNNNSRSISKVPVTTNKLDVALKDPVKNTTSIDKEIFEQPQTEISKEPKPELPKDIQTINRDTVVVTTITALKDSISQQQEAKQPSISTDTSAKKKIVLNNKWKKKINIAIGSSGYGSISVFKGYAMADANGSPSPATGVGNGIISKPSDIKNGVAYSAGFALARKLSEHIEVSLGLQYTHYSTTINVGTNRRSDTILQSGAGSFAANQYYTNTNANNKYVNRFHTLELPVTISYKPVLKWPVLLSVGAAYGQLLSTNALTYSGTANLYYQDKGNYVHQMLPLFSSIEAELFGKKRTSFRIGPIMQYNLLKIKKENTGNDSHLVFAGIKSSIIF
ncbi:MAG: hypothetical protein EOO10_00450 [Chitinophagaceae bacterium]|nr:MAG: hypothetical protein EOO10_00450 [Chitinophagaceae bacterium]